MDIDNISIIIPTYNRGPLIRQCLDAVLAQQYTGSAVEVIVVNDGSIDDTGDIVASYDNVRLITQKNAGPGAARNTGVSEAQGQIVVFTDDDCIPEPDWLQHLLAAFSDSDIAGAKGAYFSRQKELIARFVQIEYEEKYDELRKHQFIDFIDTYSAAFRKDVFLKMGGYDVSFSAASVEDQDFSFKLANAGYKLSFVPEARVWHRHVDTVSGYLYKKAKIGFWKILVFSNNPNKIVGDSHTPATLKLQITLVLISPLALVGFFNPIVGFIVLLIITVAFILSTLPLTLRCAKTEPVVALSAPFFIVCRAVALTYGLLRGSIRKIAGDVRLTRHKSIK